jgi:hypothetical protein
MINLLPQTSALQKPASFKANYYLSSTASQSPFRHQQFPPTFINSKMTLTLQQYKEILTVALDHWFAQLKGGIVFDNYDPVVESEKFLRARVERFVKQKKIEKLEKMLQSLIQTFRYKDEHDFALFLFQKTGYKIEPIPREHISQSKNRNLRVGISGKAEHALTYVSIELPTGSGSIYSVKGSHPEVKADWLDAQTIEVQIPAIREEVQRISRVSMYGETINILYKEQNIDSSDAGYMGLSPLPVA